MGTPIPNRKYIIELSINSSADNLNTAYGVFISRREAAQDLSTHLHAKMDGALSAPFLCSLSLLTVIMNHLQHAIILHFDRRENHLESKMQEQRMITQARPRLRPTSTVDSDSVILKIHCI